MAGIVDGVLKNCDEKHFDANSRSEVSILLFLNFSRLENTYPEARNIFTEIEIFERLQIFSHTFFLFSSDVS